MAIDAAYVTSLANVTVTGWAKVGDIYISVEPLRDSATGGYAHLSYSDALQAVSALGATLPTHDDIIAAHLAAVAAGFELDPVFLPDADMIHTAGIASSNEAAIDAFRNQHMMGAAWCKIHDDAVQAQLTAKGWDSTAPIFNAGKHWEAGAPPGRAWLMGWFYKGAWVQSGVEAPGARGFHDDSYSDYATTTLAKRTSAPEEAS